MFRLKKNIFIPIFLYLFCVSVYLLFLSNSVLLVDGYKRFDLTESLVEEGRFIKECRFPPGQSLAQIPFYLTGKLVVSPFDLEEPLYVSKFFVNLIDLMVVPLIVVFLFFIFRQIGFSAKVSVTVSLLYAFCTMAFHYSRFNSYEPLLTLYLVISCYCLVRWRASSRLGYFLVFALILFLLPVHHFTMFLLVGVIYLFLFLKRKELNLRYAHLVLATISIAAAAGFCMYYNYARYGSLWLTGYHAGVGIDADLGWNPRIYQGIYGLLLSPAKSIFLYNPVLILSIIAARQFFRERRDSVIGFYIIVPFLFLLLFYSAWWSFCGECAWGPRFLFPAIPFLMIPAAVFIRDFRWKRTWVKTTAVLIVSLSLIIQLVSIVVHFKHFYFVLSPYLGTSDITSVQALRLNYQPVLSQFVIFYRAFSHPDYFDLRWFKEFSIHPLIYGTIIGLLVLGASGSFYLLQRSSSLFKSGCESKRREKKVDG